MVLGSREVGYMCLDGIYLRGFIFCGHLTSSLLALPAMREHGARKAHGARAECGERGERPERSAERAERPVRELRRERTR